MATIITIDPNNKFSSLIQKNFPDVIIKSYPDFSHASKALFEPFQYCLVDGKLDAFVYNFLNNIIGEGRLLKVFQIKEKDLVLIHSTPIWKGMLSELLQNPNQLLQAMKTEKFRQCSRLDLILPVRCRLSHLPSTDVQNTYITNLSIAGAFILGSFLEPKMTFSGQTVDGLNITFEAVTKWIKPYGKEGILAGAGVEFKEVSDPDAVFNYLVYKTTKRPIET